MPSQSKGNRPLRDSDYFKIGALSFATSPSPSLSGHLSHRARQWKEQILKCGREFLMHRGCGGSKPPPYGFAIILKLLRHPPPHHPRCGSLSQGSSQGIAIILKQVHRTFVGDGAPDVPRWRFIIYCGLRLPSPVVSASSLLCKHCGRFVNRPYGFVRNLKCVC